jgi:hypothetical protein
LESVLKTEVHREGVQHDEHDHDKNQERAGVNQLQNLHEVVPHLVFKHQDNNWLKKA